MTPYYDETGVTIYHGDCREVMTQMLAESTDLIVTDPPYGIGYVSNGRTGNSLGPIVGDNALLDVPAAIGQALRILKDNRHLYVFGRFDLTALPIGPCVELIWDKQLLSMGNLSLPWGSSHEPITFTTRVAIPAQRRRNTGALTARLRKGSVIRAMRRNAVAMDDAHVRHPTEKPVSVLRQLIESSSLLGETVFDPFMGCGSTLVAAVAEGRDAIGIEIEERYCEAAANRLRQGVLWAS